MSYYGDCELSFSHTGIEGGIKDIEVEAALRVILKPLQTQVPHLSAVQIYLLRHPVVNFELTSALSMLDMFTTGDLIRSILKEQISRFLVYPNTISIKLCPNADDLFFKMPSIDGVVRVEIINVQEVSEPKIYLDVCLGSEATKSKVVDVNFDIAKFNEKCEFVSYNEGDNELKIVVNKAGEDEEQSTEIGR